LTWHFLYYIPPIIVDGKLEIPFGVLKRRDERYALSEEVRWGII